MVTDILGNEIVTGDLVQIQHGNAVLIGRVKDAKAGAVVTPGGQMIKPGNKVVQHFIPGTVEVVVILTTNMNDPNNPGVASNMVKLVDTNIAEREAFVAAHGGRRTGLLV